MRTHICYAGYIRAYIECSVKTDMIISLQLKATTASAHTLIWVVTSLSRSVCTAKQVPRPFCSLLDKCMPNGRHFEGLQWEQTRPESRHVELTSCRRSVAGHQRLLQFCCALLRAPPEPPCEVHPRLYPLHCTSTLPKWDTCTGCVLDTTQVQGCADTC